MDDTVVYDNIFDFFINSLVTKCRVIRVHDWDSYWDDSGNFFFHGFSWIMVNIVTYFFANSSDNCGTNCYNFFDCNRRNVHRRVVAYLVYLVDLNSNCRTSYFFMHVDNYRSSLHHQISSHRHCPRFENSLVQRKVCHWNFYVRHDQVGRRCYYGWLCTDSTNFVHNGYDWVEPNDLTFNHCRYGRVIVCHFHLNSTADFLNASKRYYQFRNRLYNWSFRLDRT